MFKKFSIQNDISNQSQVKSSTLRSFRSLLSTEYTLSEQDIDSILPKKSIVLQLKSKAVNLYSIDDRVRFYTIFDGILTPTLKLLHQCTS